MYESLAAESSDILVQAEMGVKQVTALYYIGSRLADKKALTKGYNVADAIVQLFPEPLPGPDEDEDEELSPEEELKAQRAELKAWALFWYGTHLAAYMRITRQASLRKKVFRAMDTLIDSKYEDLYQYGAHRVLGRVRFKLPGIVGGSKKKARKHLKIAFEGSLIGEDVRASVHGLNNLYYVEVLLAFKEKQQACQILQTFVKQDPETLLTDRIPETRDEIEQAKGQLKSLHCNK